MKRFQHTSPTRHVYYSLTEENPFLPDWYVDQLKRDLDPVTAQRMLGGQWVTTRFDKIYHQYVEALHFNLQGFAPKENHPVWWSHDFNIGAGKPISSCFFQYIDDRFHFFDEIVIDSGRTEDVIQEAFNRGLLHPKQMYYITGDRNGKNKDTRQDSDDYNMIFDALEAARIPFVDEVPTKNPEVRTRHNKVNAYLMNAMGERRVTLYQNCEVLNKGMKYTKLKKGAHYIEDDSKREQHVTTALGYGIVRATKNTEITFGSYG